ncbi:MAG: low molecular weight phosphotyrosine protein phosphatase [Selenomonadales bacterium]|nr:low molecular weight phosphotyrosine protein phosphatase [Selenomonadales bacterium]MDY3740165.1 low molecular weight protein-tyrosine-phosphatase [Selenomonadaceae bacterium]MEE1361554.1 low molecular weight protein-tyrosine-phosphatase [Selenomonadaceae bacterium]
MKNILFVCHGNICRSTMAEFVMKDLVRKAGREEEFHIQSAATHRDEIGSDTHYGTKEILKLKGVPFTPRHAVQMVKADYEKYDLIIGMDSENMTYIKRIIGEDTENKVHLLLSFAGEKRSVADPWYTGDFDKTYDDVVKGCTALLQGL